MVLYKSSLTNGDYIILIPSIITVTIITILTILSFIENFQTLFLLFILLDIFGIFSIVILIKKHDNYVLKKDIIKINEDEYEYDRMIIIKKLIFENKYRKNKHIEIPNVVNNHIFSYCYENTNNIMLLILKTKVNNFSVIIINPSKKKEMIEDLSYLSSNIHIVDEKVPFNMIYKYI